MAPNTPTGSAGYPGFVAEPPAGGGEGGTWNPTAESVAPVRGRHRVVKQRGGSMARSSAVLGVGVIAAVGAGGMATAKERPPVSIAVPDLSRVVNQLPDAESLPGIGSLVRGDAAAEGATAGDAGTARQAAAPLTQAGLTTAEAEQGTGAGEALRARIMRQAEQQQSAADAAERTAAERAAATSAAAEAAETAQAQAEAEAAEEAKRKKAAEDAQAQAERAGGGGEEDGGSGGSGGSGGGDEDGSGGTAKASGGHVAPLASYTLTSTFGESGSMWSRNHTGQDFAAPTGTPVKAVHGGTITQAGWAGAYGYRIVLTLPDGTEIWYCHLSSMTKTSGSVGAGETIGRVGATGNVTGPHLHLEVRPGGGSPVNPLSWLRGHGVDV
ncbi:M23 family metallopeptidase [Streptomyces sp. URMC 123]|uniref:M23 family metallopeptidase n=1 Tax=Streptomyces sp. URMC 123 TaxID=3423403 RepID=UPI003F1DADCD